MPNLKEEILNLLKDFPPTNPEGKTFEALLDDLAEDIQAAVIRAVIASPNREAVGKVLAALLPTDEGEQATDALVAEMTNDVVGATINNVVFLAGYPLSPQLIRRMLKPLAVQQLANQGARWPHGKPTIIR